MRDMEVNALRENCEKIDRRVILCCVFVCVAFVFFHYGLGYRVNYQPDIYGRVSITSNDLLGRIVNRDGRPLNVLIMSLLRHGSFTVVYYISLMVGLAFIILATSRFALFLISEVVVSQNRKNSVLQSIVLSVVSCLTVANLFSVEFFQYIDMTVTFTLAICLSVEAAILYVRSLHENDLKNCWKSLVFLLPVSFLYETISSLFIVLTLPFILKYSLNFGDFVKKQFGAGICYAIPLLFKVIFTRVVINSERAQFNKPSFSESAQLYAPKGRSPEVFIFDRITFGMWGYAILCVFVSVMLLTFFIRGKRYAEIIKVVYLSVVVGIVGLLPFLVGVTNDYKPRIYYPLGAFFGVLCIYALLIEAIHVGLLFRCKQENIFALALVFMVGIQWLSFVQMYVDCYITNYEDRYISEMIGACIDEYEKESGYHVDRVVFYEDAVKTKYSINGWCLTARVYAAWNEREALNMYLNRDYVSGQPDDELALAFYSKDWDCFSNDQVVCRGNTAHICKY